MKCMLFAMPLVVIGLSAGVAQAETASKTKAPMETSAKTKEFIQKAVIGGMFEVESSKVALTKAENAEVKSFAQMMVTDHSKANKSLKKAVAAARIPAKEIPAALDESHQDELADLNDETGTDFDSDYVDAMVEGHDKTVALFEDYAKDGDAPALKKFAAATLPTLKQHQDHIKTLDKAVN